MANTTESAASRADTQSNALPARLGLPNPATRFRKLFPYLGTALVVIIAAAGSATIRGMASSRNWLDHTYEVKSQLADLELEQALLHQYAAQNRSRITAEVDAGLHSAAQAVQQSLGRLQELTNDDAAEQQPVVQLVPLIQRHVQEIERAARAAGNAPAPAPDARVATREVPALAQANDQTEAAISRIVTEINTRESQLLGTRQAAWNRDFQRNIGVLAFAVGACLLLLFTNMHLLREDVRSSRIAAEHIRNTADSYRALSSRIIGLQDSERKRIGRELHDSVGQSLSALQMDLEQLLAAAEPARSALLNESRELVQRTAQEVRTISHLLHPPLLEVVGFVPAAQNYVQQFSRRSRIEGKTNFPEGFRLPSKEAELMLFRVLQESLTNVHRHAQATTVDVWLARHPHEVILTIQDNGRGLPQGVLEKFEAGVASGVGLAGMRERLAEFGGTLHVESSHSGTIVRASIPVEQTTQMPA